MLIDQLACGIGLAGAIVCTYIVVDPQTAPGLSYSRLCGTGPIVISEQLGAECCGGCKLTPQQNPSGAPPCCPCPVKAEKWTDWPECGGRPVVSRHARD